MGRIVSLWSDPLPFQTIKTRIMEGLELSNSLVFRCPLPHTLSGL